MEAGEISDRIAFETVITRGLSTSQSGGSMATLAQQYREEGRQQGIEQGIEVVALRLLKKNMAIDEVVDATELPEQRIQELQLLIIK
jgi:predicted transposase/invertase (TIGR01784 family)